MDILIHTHIYYRNLLPEIAKCVDNIRVANEQSNVVVFATCPDDCGLDFEQDVNAQLKPNRILNLPNCGYDIGPFFEILSQEDLSRYDLVIKLHTKRDAPPLWVNFKKLVNSEWRDALLSPFATVEDARKNIKLFECNPKLGLVAGKKIIDVNGFAVLTDQQKIEEEIKNIGLYGKHPIRVWGSMFIIRASILNKLPKLNISAFAEVSKTYAHHDYGKAALYEELIPVVVQAAGYRIASGTMPVRIEQIKYSLLRPIYTMIRWLHSVFRSVVRINPV